MTTAIAFEIFRREAVTAAVIEVGLGGRFDATNVITPAVAAITSIAFDHERHLGSTLAEIAFEKAGIIKPSVPVVVGDLPAEARRVIVARAKEQRAPVVEADRRYIERVDMVTRPGHALAGDACRSLRQRATGLERRPSGGQRHRRGACARNIRRAGAAARVERRSHRLDGRRMAGPSGMATPRGYGEVLIDAAHNPAGAATLAEYLAEAGVAPIPLILGVMKDKDVDAIVTALAPVVSSFIATEVDSPRALPAADLAARIAATVSEDPGQRHRAARYGRGANARGGSTRGRGWLDLSCRPATSPADRRGATHVVEPA